MKTMTAKIAAYKTTEFESNWITIFQYDEKYPDIEGRVRISEPVEVELPLLPESHAVNAELAVIDADEKKLRADHQLRLNALADRRSKLLSITHQVES